MQRRTQQNRHGEIDLHIWANTQRNRMHPWCRTSQHGHMFVVVAAVTHRQHSHLKVHLTQSCTAAAACTLLLLSAAPQQPPLITIRRPLFGPSVADTCSGCCTLHTPTAAGAAGHCLSCTVLVLGWQPMQCPDDASRCSAAGEPQLLADDRLVPQRYCNKHPEESKGTAPCQELGGRESDWAARALLWGEKAKGGNNADEACC